MQQEIIAPGALTRREWVKRIGSKWQGACSGMLESIFAIGRDLLQAKEDLEHGEFIPMIEGDLPFGRMTAHRFMVVAADSRLTNVSTMIHLPPHHITLHKISQLDDEIFERLLEDRTISPECTYADIAGIVSQYNRRKKHQKIAADAQMTLADKGPFPVICADPPWKWGHFGERDQENEKGKGRTPDQHYPTLTHDEILDYVVEGMPVIEIAHEDAALFLWCTSSNIPNALEVMIRWGFIFKASAVWVKQDETGKLQQGMGLVFRNAHEVILYGTRGKMPGPQYQPPSVFFAPRGKHSEKPDEVYKAIERMFPEFNDKTRLEMFGRKPRKGWAVHGFEAKGSSD